MAGHGSTLSSSDQVQHVVDREAYHFTEFRHSASASVFESPPRADRYRVRHSSQFGGESDPSRPKDFYKYECLAGEGVWWEAVVVLTSLIPY